MTDEPQYYRPALRLRLLGYSRRKVEVALAEGRMAVEQLREQAQQLQEQIARLGGDNERMRGELEATRAREHELQRMRVAAEQNAVAIEEDARSRARAIVADAEERAAQARGEASLRAEEASRQIDELLHVREGIAAAMRAAMQRLEREVARIERGELETQAEHEQPAEISEPHAAHAAPRADGDGRVFDPAVELDAGPFADFAELSSFERALGRMPKVQDVYIRRFADERATIELTLVEPAPLLDLLHDVMPLDFDVVAATSSSLKLTVASVPRVGGLS